VPPIVPLQELFEELNRRIDKPIDYNHILSSWIQSFGAQNIVFVDGMPYLPDPSRGKLLSIGRPVLSAAYYGLNQSSRYLRMDGVTMAGAQGFLMPRDATITAMWAKSRSTGSWNVEVRKNGIPITLVSIPVVGSFGSDSTIDVDVYAGDFLQFYLNGTAVDHPIAGVEIAWRANV